MTDASVAETVIAIIAEKALLQPSQITPDSALSDLGLDSLAMVEAIFALEEMFDIEIPFSAQDDTGEAADFDISTVGAIIVGVEGLLAHQAA